MALSTRPYRIHFVLSCMLALLVGITACKSDEQKLAEFMQRGNEYTENEQYEEAIIEYRNVLQIDPNHAPAHEALAEAYMRVKKFKEGYWELGETVRLDPDNIDARLAYATVSLAAQRHEDVLEQADAIIALDPEHAPAHLLRGQALAQLGREDEVEAELLRAVELQPEDASYRVVIAAYYHQQGKHAEAERQLLKATELKPGPIAFTMLGRLYMDLERYADAEKAFQRSLEVASEPDEEGNENANLASSYQNLASFYFQRDRAAEGVAVLEQGIETVEDKSQLVEILARYYRSQGMNDEADALLERATTFDPTDPQPFLVVSNLRGRAGDHEGALEAADQALAADPDYVPARLRKAELLIDFGAREKDDARFNEGREIVESVLANNPSMPEALFVRGKFFIASGDYDAGVEDLRGAIDGRPEWPQAHFALGSVLLLKGETQRARAELARSVELEPGLTEARRLLVKVHADLGEHEYAIENGERYLRARPDDDDTRIVVAQSMVRLGQLDEAVRMLRAVPEERRGPEANYAIGRVELARGNTGEARTLLLAANEGRPNDPRILGALLALDRASGDVSPSVARVDAAVAARPDDAALRELQGNVRRLNGDNAGAEEAYQKAIEIDPASMGAYRQLARLYARTNRLGETIGLYEQAVVAQPENAGTHHFLGVLYEMTGQADKAMEQYDLALQYDSDLGETKNNLAYILAERGEDLDRALKLAQEAKAAMPDSANAADTLGWVLYKRGVNTAAIGYLREALQLLDENDLAFGEIRTHLSLAYEASGDRDKAIETLEVALADLERMKQAGRIRSDPPWAESARANIERLKSAG